MTTVAPSAAFNRVDLKIRRISAAKAYGRIHRAAFPDPLGYGFNPTRFSDPQVMEPGKQFGVIYLGSSLEVCFLEAILRDQRNGAVGDYPLEMAELENRFYSSIIAREPLKLADLTGDKKILMGIPSDVSNAADQTLGRLWSEALYLHPARVDGIVYESRLSRKINLAVYDRGAAKLTTVATVPMLKAPEFPRIINRYKVAIV
jgi:hypothetical protein